MLQSYKLRFIFITQKNAKKGILIAIFFRYFIPTKHKPHFDAIVNQNYAAGAGGFDSLSPRSTESSPRDKDIRKSREDLSGSK